MSVPPSKRRRLDLNRNINPPPLQRQAKEKDVLQLDRVPATTQAQTVNLKSGLKSVDGTNQWCVISWNINGIRHLLPETQRSMKDFLRHPSPQGEDSSKWDGSQPSSKQSPLRKFLRRHDFPHILCLQEVKIAPGDSVTRRAVEKAANGTDGTSLQYSAHFSLPRDKFNARGWGGKLYGVCTLIRTDLLHSNTREVNWDLEGRVLISTFEKWKLVVINGYWVNGTMNPYRDSTTGHVVGTRHDRKRAFHSLMLKEVKSLEREGYDILLVGDMNVARCALNGFPGIRLGKEHILNRQDFNAKFFHGEAGMRGVDTWRHIHGDERGYTFHGESASEWGRSCDRVDLGIASRKLVDTGALVGADIWESVEERGGSDHVPIGVTLDVAMLDRKLPEGN